MLRLIVWRAKDLRDVDLRVGIMKLIALSLIVIGYLIWLKIVNRRYIVLCSLRKLKIIVLHTVLHCDYFLMRKGSTV